MFLSQVLESGESRWNAGPFGFIQAIKATLQWVQACLVKDMHGQASRLCRLDPYCPPVHIIMTTLDIALGQQAFDHCCCSRRGNGEMVREFLHGAAFMIDKDTQECQLSGRCSQLDHISPTRASFT